MRTLNTAFEHFARLLFDVYAPVEVTAREHLPAEPFLLCSNHASHMDAPALMIAAGLPFDAFRLLAAADYFDPETLGGRLTHSMLHIVAIDRTEGHSVRLRRTVSHCRELVEDHHVRLIAFPEGTRSRTGDLLAFKRGPSFLAVALGLPVVPARIDGTHRAMPKGRWFPLPARICVRFGRPIRPEEWAPVSGQKARCDYVTRELEQRIRALT
jgi:1-acyl-sn-glycerol-3-phosphate acyltransferase